MPLSREFRKPGSKKPSATVSKTIFQAAGNRPDVFFGMHLVYNAVADIMALEGRCELGPWLKTCVQPF